MNALQHIGATSVGAGVASIFAAYLWLRWSFNWDGEALIGALEDPAGDHRCFTFAGIVLISLFIVGLGFIALVLGCVGV